MTVSHTKALDLLGKDISFTEILTDDLKTFFPDGLNHSGIVEAVIITLTGDYEILVSDTFYSLSSINIH